MEKSKSDTSNKNERMTASKMATFLIAGIIMVVFTAILATSAYSLTDTTRPTIISVSPTNNEQDIATHDKLTVQFSEPMDASTINEDTFILEQRTTPPPGSASSDYRSRRIEGTVTYSGLIATFRPKNPNPSLPTYNPLQPSQEFGNVFTVTLTGGIQDLTGNSLARNYVWSFTTGGDAFNTGTTTSQSNQSAIAITGSAVVPPVQPVQPVAQSSGVTAPAATSWFLSAWFIGGLLMLIAIALVLSIAMKPARQKNVRTTINPNPSGFVHPVADIEGIGPEYSKRLQAMGIRTTAQLWNANAAKVALGLGVSQNTVKSWQSMAELASVKDIGPQYAELLERSGIHSIEQLKNYDPDELLMLVREKQDSLKVNIQGNSPGYATVEHWIAEAQDHKFGATEGINA